MSLPARKLEVIEVMADQAVLEERIDHLQGDVTDIKKNIGRLDDKIDALRKDIADQRTELVAAIGGVETRLTAAMGTMQFRLVTWMVGTTLTCVGLAIGIVKFMK